MSPGPQPLTLVLDQLKAMNPKLLQLSAEIGSENILAGGLIKEILGDIQSLTRQIQEAVRQTTGVEDESDELRREIERQRMLLEVTGQFHSTLDQDEIAAKILDSILGWVGAERGLLLLQDSATGEHLVKVGRELTESSYESSEIVIPRTVVGRVLKERVPIYAADVQGDHSLMAMASVRDLSVRSLACLPLLINDEILGVLYFDYQAATRKLGPDERVTLEAVCCQAAKALMNANRYRRAREWARKSNREGVGRMIGTSRSMREVFGLIGQVALSPDTSVLITGASGTGKELAARAIHDLSSRAEEPFVAVNCAAIPATLLESELFGYEKGAFTDAVTRRTGLLEQADRGTLFLDEIGEMSAALQSKLLRVLEDRTFRRLGGDRDIPVKIRVITATNIDIKQAVESGDFREDLYYRLNVFPIELPPLSDRGDDVVLIANAIIEELNGKLGTRFEPIDPEGLVCAALIEYEWPGNVRELRNVLERAMILSRGRELTLKDFPRPIGSPDILRSVADGLIGGESGEPWKPSGLTTLNEVEEAYIDRVMESTSGDKSRAAGILGINVSTLYRRLGRREAE